MVIPLTRDVMGEWGKINSGQRYTAVVYDVGTALACANLRDYEAILVDRIKVQSWSESRLKGLPDPEPTYVNIRELAKALGCAEQRLYGAKYRLIKAKIITDHDGRLAINKEAHEWIDPDSPKDDPRPLLSPERLSYARSMRTFGQPDKPARKPRTHKPGVVAPNADALNSDALNADEFNANRLVHLTHPRYTPNADELVPTIEERARDSEEKKISEERVCDAGEPFESPGELRKEITGPGPKSPEGKALIEWARTLGGDHRGASYADWASAAVAHAPAEWIKHLLNYKVAVAASRAPVLKLAHILGTWREMGHPDCDITAPPTGRNSGPSSGKTKGELRREKILRDAEEFKRRRRTEDAT